MEPQEEAIQRYMAIGYNRDQATTHARSEILRNSANAAEEARVAKLKSEGKNADGSMIMPEYQSLIDPATGLLKKEYQMNVGTIDPAKLEGYQALRTEATRTGPSVWAQLQKKLLNVNRSADMDKATTQASTGAATARGSLAMRGGLSSGARERIAMNAGKNQIEARQGVGRQATINNLNLDTTDEQNRLGTLKSFNDSELGVTKYNTDTQNKGQEFNITRALEEKARKDAAEQLRYTEENKKWVREVSQVWIGGLVDLPAASLDQPDSLEVDLRVGGLHRIDHHLYFPSH